MFDWIGFAFCDDEEMQSKCIDKIEKLRQEAQEKFDLFVEANGYKWEMGVVIKEEENE